MCMTCLLETASPRIPSSLKPHPHPPYTTCSSLLAFHSFQLTFLSLFCQYKRFCVWLLLCFLLFGLSLSTTDVLKCSLLPLFTCIHLCHPIQDSQYNQSSWYTFKLSILFLSISLLTQGVFSMEMFAVGGQKMLYKCLDGPLYIMSGKVSRNSDILYA